MHHGSGFCNGLFSCFVILRVFAGGEGRVFWGRYGGIIHNIHDKKIIDVLLHIHRLYCKFDHFYREQVGKIKKP